MATIDPDSLYGTPTVMDLTGLSADDVRAEGDERDVEVVGGRQVWRGAEVLALLDDLSVEDEDDSVDRDESEDDDLDDDEAADDLDDE